MEGLASKGGGGERKGLSKKWHLRFALELAFKKF